MFDLAQAVLIAAAVSALLGYYYKINWLFIALLAGGISLMLAMNMPSPGLPWWVNILPFFNYLTPIINGIIFLLYFAGGFITGAIGAAVGRAIRR